MKNEKCKKFLTISFLAFSLSIMLIPYNHIQASSPQQVRENAVITTYSDKIQWVFDTINGKRYKRLYNFSTRTWIGDWILIG